MMIGKLVSVFEMFEYDIYFNLLFSFYCDWCFVVGEVMYEWIGILCEDKGVWWMWFVCNFVFFGVLFVLFVIIDWWMGLL